MAFDTEITLQYFGNMNQFGEQKHKVSQNTLVLWPLRHSILLMIFDSAKQNNFSSVRANVHGFTHPCLTWWENSSVNRFQGTALCKSDINLLNQSGEIYDPSNWKSQSSKSSCSHFWTFLLLWSSARCLWFLKKFNTKLTQFIMVIAAGNDVMNSFFGPLPSLVSQKTLNKLSHFFLEFAES